MAPPDSLLAARVCAELLAVRVAVSMAPFDASSPERLLREGSARAVIRVVPSSELEVWVVDVASDQPRLVECRANAADPASYDVLPRCAAEVVRAALDSPPPPMPAPPESSPADASPRDDDDAKAPLASASPSRLRESLSLSPAVTATAGGPSPSIGVRLAGEIFARDGWFGVQAFALVPGVRSRVPESMRGSATIASYLLGIGPEARLANADARWVPRLGAGVALAWLHLEGIASFPWKGRSDELFTAVVYAGGGASVRLWRGVRLGADAWIGAAVPQAAVAFGGQEVATWGRPLVVGSLGMEFLLP
jgi:hypothetical protein